MTTPAAFWKPTHDTTVQCLLCPNTCTIPPGKRGRCGVRENQAGTLVTLIYGKCSGVAIDPIEKKPLYHFLPGTHVLSLGSVGCSLACQYCQNYHISSATPDKYPLQDLSPDEAVTQAQQDGCAGIAWTYNEPTIWYEYVLESAKLAKQAHLATVSVTNGYITPDALTQLAPHLDAMNIDVKAFTDTFYKKICKGSLTAVLEACELAHRHKIHLELTYLIIPGLNDSRDELRDFCQWVATHLQVTTPVHFSRFHPDYRLTTLRPTPVSTLTQAYDIAKQEGLQYVYLGNVPHGTYDNTYCPKCKNLLIERIGFSAHLLGLEQGRCTVCHTPIPIITSIP